MRIKGLSLTEFAVSTVGYGPSFPPPFDQWSKRGSHESKDGEGMKIRKLQYGPREDEASKIFIISLLCLTGSGTISIHTGRLQIFDAPQKQNEPI